MSNSAGNNAGNSKSKRQVEVTVFKTQPTPTKVEKAENATNLSESEVGFSDWIQHPFAFKGLKDLVEDSTILPQCIAAYRNNIAGYGIELRYIDDAGEETAEMKEEWDKAKRIIDLLTTDGDTKKVFEDIIEARETYGIAYLEVIRNLAGEVVSVEFLTNPGTVEKTIPESDIQTYPYFYKGEKVEKKKRFRRYKQTKNGKTVYFKEFNDPRLLDKDTGDFKTELEIAKRANELLEFKIGVEDYGRVRWYGQIRSVTGSKKAEDLNLNYFENGRHTPLAVVVSGGTLSEQSRVNLGEYLKNIKGEAGQHAFLLLEVEDDQRATDFEDSKKPTIELKDMASILQKDELFQEYIDNGRRKAQSAFRLPDLYTGYTTDFNRATAQTAFEITEKQVFQPERKELAWVLNNKLLNGYGFKYVEAYFAAPDITNPDDIAHMLEISASAGGMTPNDARRLLWETTGWGSEENYDDSWGNTPLAVITAQGYAAATAGGDGKNLEMTRSKLDGQIGEAVKKAEQDGDEDVAEVLREIRRMLKEREAGNEDET